MANVEKIFKMKDSVKQNFTGYNKNPEAIEDYSVKKNVATREGTIEKYPVHNNDIANKYYVDTKVASASEATDHSLLANLYYASAGHIGFVASASLSDHTGSVSIHFTVPSISHILIDDIGSNSHSDIDTHIASASIHRLNGGTHIGDTETYIEVDVVNKKITMFIDGEQVNEWG